MVIVKDCTGQIIRIPEGNSYKWDGDKEKFMVVSVRGGDGGVIATFPGAVWASIRDVEIDIESTCAIFKFDTVVGKLDEIIDAILGRSAVDR